LQINLVVFEWAGNYNRQTVAQTTKPRESDNFTIFQRRIKIVFYIKKQPLECNLLVYSAKMNYTGWPKKVSHYS